MIVSYLLMIMLGYVLRAVTFRENLDISHRLVVSQNLRALLCSLLKPYLT